MMMMMVVVVMVEDLFPVSEELERGERPALVPPAGWLSCSPVAVVVVVVAAAVVEDGDVIIERRRRRRRREDRPGGAKLRQAVARPELGKERKKEKNSESWCRWGG